MLQVPLIVLVATLRFDIFFGLFILICFLVPFLFLFFLLLLFVFGFLSFPHGGALAFNYVVGSFFVDSCTLLT